MLARGRMGRGSRVLLLSCGLLLLAAQAAAGRARRLLQDEEEGEEAAGEVCVSGDFPLEFKRPVTFNVNEGIGFFKDDSTNLECHCESQHCDCTGEGDDCDEYSQVATIASSTRCAVRNSQALLPVDLSPTRMLCCL
jgi:hypothetical protein